MIKKSKNGKNNTMLSDEWYHALVNEVLTLKSSKTKQNPRSF